MHDTNLTENKNDKINIFLIFFYMIANKLSPIYIISSGFMCARKVINKFPEEHEINRNIKSTAPISSTKLVYQNNSFPTKCGFITFPGKWGLHLFDIFELYPN